MNEEQFDFVENDFVSEVFEEPLTPEIQMAKMQLEINELKKVADELIEYSKLQIKFTKELVKFLQI